MTVSSVVVQVLSTTSPLSAGVKRYQTLFMGTQVYGGHGSSAPGCQAASVLRPLVTPGPDRTVAFEKLSFPGGAPTPEALADIATASAIAPVPMRVRPQRSRCRQAERLNLIGACNLHPGELALNLSSACGGLSQEPAVRAHAGRVGTP